MTTHRRLTKGHGKSISGFRFVHSLDSAANLQRFKRHVQRLERQLRRPLSVARTARLNTVRRMRRTAPVGLVGCAN